MIYWTLHHQVSLKDCQIQFIRSFTMKKLAYYIINQKCLIYCYLLFSNENFANCCKLKLSENGYKVVNGRLYNNIFESHVIMEPNKVRKDQIDRTANMIQQLGQSEALAQLNANGQDLTFLNINSSEHRYLQYSLQRSNNGSEWHNIDGKYYTLISIQQKKMSGINILSNDKRYELIKLIRKLDTRKISIIEMSYFCLQNAMYSTDITLSITQAFNVIPFSQQQLLLYVINDILHNSSLHHEYFWTYRIGWEECLPYLFDRLAQSVQNTKNLEEIKNFKNKTQIILDSWKSAGIYDKKFINGLGLALNNNMNLSFYSPCYYDISDRLSVFETKILPLNEEQLNEMCKQRGQIYYNNRIQGLNRLMNYKACKLNCVRRNNVRLIDIEGAEMNEEEVTQVLSKEAQVHCNQDLKYIQQRFSNLKDEQIEKKLKLLLDGYFTKEQVQSISQYL